MSHSTDANRWVRFAIVSLLATSSLLLSGGVALAEGGDANVRNIVAPVLNIETGTADIAGAAKVEEREEQVHVTLRSEVLFNKDSAELRKAARSRLKDIADRFTSSGPGPIKVVGYTDDLGSAAHGLTLSRQRAQAVAKVLKPLLSGDYRFTVVGKGEADPAVPNDSEANRKLNRRVELNYRPE